MGYRHASLARASTGAFKARKVIPVDVRSAYARLYGLRWEAIFSAPAGTPSAEVRAAHAEWLALVERRIACLRMSPHPGLSDRPEALLAIPQATVIQGGPFGGVEPPGPTCQPAAQGLPARHTNVALFDAYALDKQPAKTTISRWRAVFLVLDTLPEPLNTQDAAQRWLDSLKTPKRSAKTVRDCWLAAARTVFRWAKRRSMVHSNPFEGCVVEVRRKIQTRETGRSFTENEARIVLRGAKATRTVPIGKPGWEWAACRRWVPWLCAYTGCRPAEATQLRACDIDLVRKTARITPEAGTVKTGKVRVVPLHDHLANMGFLEFVKGVTAAMGPQAPLFYRLPQGPSRNPLYRGPAVKARERLAEWVRGLGISDPSVSPNHAWRHTFKMRAARVGIEPRFRDAICGHAPRTVADQYEAPTVEDMAVALGKFLRWEVS